MNATPAAPQFELFVFISLLGLLAWAAAFGHSFRQGQVSMWSLVSLVTLLAIAWALAANFHIIG